MKSILKIISILAMAFLISCGGDSNKKEDKSIKIGQKTQTEKKQEPAKTESKTAGIDLNNKGIGPISSVDISADIDASMASRGEEVFGNLCTACHKMDKRYIGPAQAGVTERRSPEWILNMILNPVEMIKKDPIAKQLLVESNMAVMANQNVPEEDARAILEYFRQYDSKN